MTKSSTDQFHFLGTCITTIGIWITCNRWNSSINCTIASRRKWRRCNNTTCHGSRLVTHLEIIVSVVSIYWTCLSFQVQFLKRAVDILCQCRQTLMCTYVFAYYLRKNNQSLIFEANQKDLESATEKLSEYLERDITSENLADIKQKVQDKYRCVYRPDILWNVIT